MPDFPTDETFAALDTLQGYCHDSARERGFHDASDDLLSAIKAATDDRDQDLLAVLQASFNDRVGNRLMLIAGEVTEAHEEIRAGREVNETYYVGSTKPEGVPSELADIIIRVMDFAGEYGIDLGRAVREKLVYNATRARMHGKKF